MKFPSLLLAALFALAFICPARAQSFYFDAGPVVYVEGNPAYPQYYDPYFNRPKVYNPRPVYYETKEKTREGKKVTTKTTITNQYGEVVYKNKSTKTVKKKKK